MTEQTKGWQVGDIIKLKEIYLSDRFNPVYKRIVEKYDGHYLWEYPDVPGEYFDSINSTDPELIQYVKTNEYLK